MARTERLAVEEFAESLWRWYAKHDTSELWQYAHEQAHGAFMFRSFVGGAGAGKTLKMLGDLIDQCVARRDLAHDKESCVHVKEWGNWTSCCDRLDLGGGYD